MRIFGLFLILAALFAIAMGANYTEQGFVSAIYDLQALVLKNGTNNADIDRLVSEAKSELSKDFNSSIAVLAANEATNRAVDEIQAIYTATKNNTDQVLGYIQAFAVEAVEQIKKVEESVKRSDSAQSAIEFVKLALSDNVAALTEMANEIEKIVKSSEIDDIVKGVTSGAGSLLSANALIGVLLIFVTI